MSGAVGRRVFVGSVAAGVPLLVGGTAMSGAQRQSAGAMHDPLAVQIIADMKSAVRALSRGASGEQARRLASSLRLLATWGTANQFDARVRQTLRDVIVQEGRDALLSREFDAARFRSEAAALGIDGRGSVPLPPLPVMDYSARQRVVDDLLTHGVTAQWRRLADTLDVAATMMDRQAAMRGQGAARLVQYTPEYCATIAQQMEYLNAQMVFWCGPWFWWVVEPCGLVTSAYLGVWLGSWWVGCV